MDTLFISLDVLEFRKQWYEEPTTTSEYTTAQSGKLKKKKIIYAEVLGMIQRGVSNTIFLRIMRAKTTQEACETIQWEFEWESNVRIIKFIFLKIDFQNEKMK